MELFREQKKAIKLKIGKIFLKRLSGEATKHDGFFSYVEKRESGRKNSKIIRSFYIDLVKSCDIINMKFTSRHSER